LHSEYADASVKGLGAKGGGKGLVGAGELSLENDRCKDKEQFGGEPTGCPRAFSSCAVTACDAGVEGGGVGFVWVWVRIWPAAGRRIG
jgi:hypothetical protein